MTYTDKINLIKFLLIVIPYEITVFTGNKPGAGTDAKVFIQMYGLNGKTEELRKECGKRFFSQLNFLHSDLLGR